MTGARSALPLALLLAACGLTREPPFAGRRAPAIAPWEDLGPVLLCDGDHRRIGAPGTLPAGLCDRQGPRRPCRRDDECGSRERCTCDGCQIALCDSAGECGGGFECNFAARRCDRPCTGDADCRGGERCDDDVCRGRCAGDGECQQGERCREGRCETQPCREGLRDCGDPQGCRLQRLPGELHEPTPSGPFADGGFGLWLERVADRPGLVAFRCGDDLRCDELRDQALPKAEGRDRGRVGAPSLLEVEGGTLLAYANGGGELRLAQRRRGGAWVVDPRPLLAPSLPWEGMALDSPALARGPGGSLLVFYSTVDKRALGLARCDLTAELWAAACAKREQPLVEPARLATAETWAEVDRLAGPFVEERRTVEGQPSLLLYLAARGREPVGSLQFDRPIDPVPNYSIAALASTDGAGFGPWPYNPIFDRVENFLTHPGEVEPAVVHLTDGRSLLLYRGLSVDEQRSGPIAAAVSPASRP